MTGAVADPASCTSTPGFPGITPVVRGGAGALDKLLEGFGVEDGGRRGAHHALVVGKRFRRGLLGGFGEQLPPRGTFCVQADGRGQVVDAGFLFVGLVAPLRNPEEITGDEAGQRRTILLGRDRGQLLAEGFKSRIRRTAWAR